MRIFGITMLILLLAAPPAQAGFFSKDTPLMIEVPPLREGDTLRFEHTGTRHDIEIHHSSYTRETIVGESSSESDMTFTVSAVQSTRTWTTLLRAEGRDAKADAYGITRETEALLLQGYHFGSESQGERCHRIVGGFDAVVVEPASDLRWGSWGSSGSASTLGMTTESHESHAEMMLVAHHAYEDCPGSVASGRFSEGDVRRLGDLVPNQGLRLDDLPSAPAERAEFHGRPALLYRFVLPAESGGPGAREHGTLSVLLADGLPGAARVEKTETRLYGDQPADSHYVVELAAYEAGEGAAFAPFVGAELPERNPAAEFVPHEPLRLPSEAFDLSFPYEDALRALREDRDAGFEAWLREHPDAMLQQAVFDSGMRSHSMVRSGADAALVTDGGWELNFDDGAAAYSATVVRYSAASTPAGHVPLPSPLLRVDYPAEGPARTWSHLGFGEVVDSASLVRIMDSYGIPSGGVAYLQYTTMGRLNGWDGIARITVSDVSLTDSPEGATTGTLVEMDVLKGKTVSAATFVQVTTRGGLLEPPTAGAGLFAARDTSALAAFVGPMPEGGLAVPAAAAATGLALLMLALKLGLVPFYSRLVRDRLLDHPVRARLLDRVRREPGIRRQELVDFAGVGEGATQRHLDQLVKHRFLIEVRDAPRAALGYYVAGDVPPEMARRAAVLRSDSMRRVYELLAAEPDLSLREAAARLGLSAPGVHRAKKKLENAGLLPAAPAAVAPVLTR